MVLQTSKCSLDISPDHVGCLSRAMRLRMGEEAERERLDWQGHTRQV